MTVLGAITLSSTPTIAVDVDQFTALENAIALWVRLGSGLDSLHVRWAREAAGADPMPQGTYISMRITGIDAVSDDWKISRRNASGGVVQHVRGTRHPTLELTCRAGSRYGSRRPGWVLAQVTAAVQLPEAAQALRRARVGIGTFGAIRIASSTRSSLFDPLATVEVELHMMLDVAAPAREFRSVGVTTPNGSARTIVKP